VRAKKCNFLEVEKRGWSMKERKDWIGAEKPVKVYPSAGRRFLTRVLIQIGERLGFEPHS